MLPRLANFARDTSGAVAPLFATALIGLVSAGALAWDISRGYAMKAELEAAVDAAALAGATQLDGQSDSLTRATTAAEGALVQNSKRMGDTYEANVVGAGDTIQYLTDLTSRTVTTSGADAKFIEITLAPRPMGLILGALVHAGGFNGRAHAVAGYGSALCKVPPMMICNPQETASSTAFDPSLLIGKAQVLTPAPSTGTWGPGMFGFLTVNSTNSGAAIKDALARNPPLAECYGEQVTPAGGNIASADDWFNMRFDIYANGQPAAKKNDPNYEPAMNTMIGVKTTASGACTPTVTAPSNDCSSTTAAASGAMGLPRDCNQTTGLGSGVWNVRKYFATNHSGIDPTTYVPLNKDGTSGGWDYYGPHAATGVTSPTRYQVYKWELAILSGDILKPASAFSAGQDGTSGTLDFAKPKCNTSGSQADPDRRTISVVVLNCKADNARPNQAANVIGYVDLFLIGPAVSQTIYTEYIQATTDTSAVGQETRIYSVRLYE
jgi:hypothetical protein